MKDKIRHWIYKRIGYPSDVQNLLNYIDSFGGDICIYPGGEFKFGIKTSDSTDSDQHFSFATPQERASFGAGLEFGIKSMGGNSAFLTDQQLQEYEEMEKFASVKGDPKKVN